MRIDLRAVVGKSWRICVHISVGMAGPGRRTVTMHDCGTGAAKEVMVGNLSIVCLKTFGSLTPFLSMEAMFSSIYGHECKYSHVEQREARR